jgi:hypothetical protein
VRAVSWSALLILSLAAAAPARSQSLSEAAQREQEKRKQAKKPAKVYTESDLKGRPDGGSGTYSQPPANRNAAASPSPSPTPEPDRALLEREWRARFAEARANIAAEDARAYEERIEVVWVSGIPVQQRVRVRVETPALKAAKQALGDLEEELRRSGGLPGWGRE